MTPVLHRSMRLRVVVASLVTLAAGALALGGWVASIVSTTPTAAQIRQAQTLTPSILLSADGQTLARLGDDVHEAVALEQVSPAVIQALLATEDRRFYEHGGIDLTRMLGAAWHSLSGPTQGGSTITQQLARNLFPAAIGRERSIERKAREIVTALRIERLYDKREILAAYLNTAPFLYDVSGIEMAARTYFGKSAAQLDVPEAATLVGMLKGAHYYDPLRHPARALERRNLVLAQMVRAGAVDAASAAALRQRPLGLRFARLDTRVGRAPHFVAFVRRQLAGWAALNGRDLLHDGLVVHTTLDARLQTLAERAVDAQAAQLQRVAGVEWSQPAMPLLTRAPKAGDTARAAPFAYFWRDRAELLDGALRESAAYRRARQAGAEDGAALQALRADPGLVERVRGAKTRLEAGFVAVEPQTGAVRAWVGSRDFAQDQFDHVAQARRQPGSTFKAFVYGAALQQGVSPDQTYVDAPVSVQLADGSLWEPTDMGGPSGLTMSLREGLAQSKNTITTQVMQQIGLQPIVDFARAAGVRDAKLDAVPSLALGTSPVSLLEMAGAYATLSALGERREPVVISRITDRGGRVLADFTTTPATPAIARPVAERLLDMMRDVVLNGTASTLRSRFGIRSDVAGKTGTTQNNTDGWFLAMQPGLVSGAWIGFNDQRVRMRSDYWGQGAHSALLIVGDFLQQAEQAGFIDAKARFPVERIEPLPTPQPDIEPLGPWAPVPLDDAPAGLRDAAAADAWQPGAAAAPAGSMATLPGPGEAVLPVPQSP